MKIILAVGIRKFYWWHFPLPDQLIYSKQISFNLSLRHFMCKYFRLFFDRRYLRT